MLRKYTTYVSVAMFFLAGCTYESKEILWVCPGEKTVAESISAVKSDSQKILSFKAHGRCYLRYYDEDKSKSRSESMSVKVRVAPPSNIYLQGDAPFVSKAVVLGSNEEEFWLSIRPKEISTHWWGNWSEQDLSEGLIIDPRTLLESLGIGEVETQEDWSLSNEGPYDIISKRQQDVVIKKIYIYSCDYRVRKIEFFNRDGQVVAGAELDKYKEVSDGFSIPSLIKVTTYGQETGESSLSITLDLKSIKPATITEPRRNVLFKHTPPKGITTVYRVVNGKWFEQDR